MKATKVTTNRELLRHYKVLKNQLLKGDVKELHVIQKDGYVIKITVLKPETPWERMKRLVHEKPIKIQRPEEDLF